CRQRDPHRGGYPDPSGAPQQRWWDGRQWTQQTQPQTAPDPGRVQRQVQQQAGIAQGATGGGTLFTEPVLVVNQKAKLIELTNEYAVYDQHGRQLGSVVQVGQSGVRKALGFVSRVGQFLTPRLGVR